jgi:hypothetical protein
VGGVSARAAREPAAGTKIAVLAIGAALVAGIVLAKVIEWFALTKRRT